MFINLQLCVAALVLLAAPLCYSICMEQNCHFELVIRQRRSMTYTSPEGVTFNVAWNETAQRLQIIENSLHKKVDHDEIGDFVSTDDVITTDGFTRNIYVVNEQFPGPTLEVMEGAHVTVKVINHVTTEGLTVHFHGIHFTDNLWMDGAGYVTQCPILPGQSFQHSFIAEPAGTHFYHGHFRSTRIDGILGAFIVHRQVPMYPYHVVMVQDWFHRDSGTLRVMNPYAPIYAGTGEATLYSLDRDYSVDGVEVSSMAYESTLIGGRGRMSDNDTLPLVTYSVAAGGRHQFHVIHPGAEHAYEIMIDGHVLEIVALDGDDIYAVPVHSVIINPGQRVDFEIETNAEPDLYWIRAEILRQGVGMPIVVDGIIKGTKAILRYDNALSSGDPKSTRRECIAEAPCTVFNCPYLGYRDDQYKHCLTLNDAQSAFTEEYLDAIYGINDVIIDEYFLNWGFHVGSSVNGRKFSLPSAPLSGNFSEHIIPCDEEECESGCYCTNILEIAHNRTVQLVFSNLQEGDHLAHHAIHIHGNSFAIMTTGYPDYNSTTGLWSKANDDVVCDTDLCAHPSWNGQRPPYNEKPVVMDTVVVPARGYTVVRFKSKNPGYWMLHCHQESHAEDGMIIVLNVAPEMHPPVPANFPVCGNFELQEETIKRTDQRSGEKTNGGTNIERAHNELYGGDSVDSDGKVSLTREAVIGMAVGFFVLGALVAAVPLLIYVCGRKQH